MFRKFYEVVHVTDHIKASKTCLVAQKWQCIGGNRSGIYHYQVINDQRNFDFNNANGDAFILTAIDIPGNSTQKKG